VNCCTALRSHPIVFVVVVALSAVAFVGETFGSAGVDDARSTTLAVAVAGGRLAHR